MEQNSKPVKKVEEAFVKPSSRDQRLLELFLMNEDEWDYLSTCFETLWIESDEVGKIIQKTIDLYCSDKWSPDALLDAFPKGKINELIRNALEKNRDEKKDTLWELRDLILKIRARHCDKIIHSLIRLMMEPGLSMDQQMGILQVRSLILESRDTPLFEEFYNLLD